MGSISAWQYGEAIYQKVIECIKINELVYRTMEEEIRGVNCEYVVDRWKWF